MSQIQKPFWFMLLDHFDKKDYFGNGLTIPFIIGSSKIITPNSEILNVHEFLIQAQNSSTGRSLAIMRCSDIGEFVISLHIMEPTNPWSNKIYKEFGNITITDGSFDTVENFSEVINTLEELYSQHIKNNTFSKENGTWGGYSESDLNRLKEVKSALV